MVIFNVLFILFDIYLSDKVIRYLVSKLLHLCNQLKF